MKSDLEYVLPDTLDEALEFLREHGEETKPIAGGTDLMLAIRTGKLRAGYLLDISRLSGLKGVEQGPEGLSIGAGVTLAEIRSSEVVGRFAPALRKASRTFASRQIRNVATIGGNVANASPCADTVPPLVAHEAVAVLKTASGERRVPVEELLSGPYLSDVRKGELIVRFILRPSEGTFFDFRKIGRRRAVATARMSMSVLADRDGEGKIRFIRLALGSCTPAPVRMKEVEEHLLGRRLDGNLLEEGGRLMARRMIAVSGRRPSTVYKERAVQGLFRRMLAPLV